MTKSWVMHVDGACSGNPGQAGIGVVIRHGDEKVKEVSEAIGKATNNIAEYSALIRGLQEAQKLKIENIKVFTDSQLMHQQLLGAYKVKNDQLRSLYNEAQKLAGGFKKVEIQHVPRELNSEADQLATQSIKKKQTKVVASLFHNSGEESPSSRG